MDYIFNKKIETLKRQNIKELQLKRLRKTVKNVYENVPFYKKKLDELNVKPDDIKIQGALKKALEILKRSKPLKN